MAVSNQVLKHPYTGLRVVEIAQFPAGESTAYLLAELGAEITKVEPKQGSASRKVGPFLHGKVSAETSLNFRYYNCNKKSVVADIETGAGMKTLRRLLADA